MGANGERLAGAMPQLPDSPQGGSAHCRQERNSCRTPSERTQAPALEQEEESKEEEHNGNGGKSFHPHKRLIVVSVALLP